MGLPSCHLYIRSDNGLHNPARHTYIRVRLLAFYKQQIDQVASPVDSTGASIDGVDGGPTSWSRAKR